MHTYPVVAEVGISQLPNGEVFERLEAARCADGVTLDLSSHPVPRQIEEIVMVSGASGHATLENHAENYKASVSWDPQGFANCNLWLSNHGRTAYPWNGRFRGLGIEPVSAPFDLGDEVANTASNPFWFQLYVIRDRDFIERLIKRAEATGIETLVVTLDLQMVGQCNKDILNGLSSPSKPTITNLLDIMRRPAWCFEMLRSRNVRFGNLQGHVKDLGDGKSLAEWTNQQFDPPLDWQAVKQLRDRLKGKLILKGIVTPEDAQIAAEIGADAIVVSNHGGRQLDGAPGTIQVLPEIARKVGGKCEVFIDGAFTSGQDVFRALASGAQGVLMGRAMLFGLGVGGQAGVEKALEFVVHQFETTMGLYGVTSVAEIGPHNIYQPA